MPINRLDSNYKVPTGTSRLTQTNEPSSPDILPGTSKVLDTVFGGGKIGEALGAKFGTGLPESFGGARSQDLKYYNTQGPSAKQVAGDVLKTGLTVATAGLPGAGTAVGRIGQGIGVGAGYGLSESLRKDAGLKDTTQNVVKGAGFGGLTSGLLEGAGALLRQVSQSGFIQRNSGNTFNKELQPSIKDLSKDISSGFKTFGEQVAGITDKSGKPVYVGTYRTLLGKAKGELAINGSQLTNSLKTLDQSSPITITRQQVAKGIYKTMQDTYGVLSPTQLRQIAFEVKRAPLEMNRTKLETTKRLYDGLIPESFWSKIGDPAQAFPSLIKYALRDNARKILNDSSDQLTQQLNNRMSIAMDMKKLTSTQLAKRALTKISETGGTGTARNPFSYFISKLIDDVILNPAITTRLAQTRSRLGTQTGLTPLRQLGRTAATRIMTTQHQQ